MPTRRVAWYAAVMTTSPATIRRVQEAPDGAGGVVVRACADFVEGAAFSLPSPVRNEKTGAVVYSMALAVPGVHSYPWGECLTPPEVLADAAWLAAIEGIPIVDDDQRDHVQGVTVEQIADRAIGSMTAAAWDAAQGAVLGRGVVDVARGLDQIAEGKRGVSVGYDAEIVEQAGVYEGKPYSHVQVRRVNPHNVAITYNPRHVVTRIQADSTAADQETNMDIKALIAALTAAKDADGVRKAIADAKPADSESGGVLMMLLERLLESEGARMASDAKCADLQAKYDAMQPPAEEAKAEEGDDTAEESDAEDEPKMGEVADALTLAESAGVTVDPTWTLGQLQRATLAKLGVATADSLSSDALTAALAVAKSTVRPVADAWDRVQRSTNTTHTSVI